MGYGAALARLVLVCLGGMVAIGLLPLLVGWPATVVMSGSMAPDIQPGDVVVARPVDPALVRPGDVIVFTDPADRRITLVHRVVAGDAANTFTTRGDANMDPDSTPVPASAIRGRALLRVPWVGLPRYWLANAAWVPLAATCILLALLAFAGVEMRPPPRHGRRFHTGRHRRRTRLRKARLPEVALPGVALPEVALPESRDRQTSASR